jgi:ABC-type antimicrobial peptide transport system permease subunit
MFWTYLRRELRRRARQAILIGLGLALGIGLVITVTAAAAGVRVAQAAVLHSLYGVGTDVTITEPPKQGSGAGITFGFRQQVKAARGGQIAAGTRIHDNELQNTQYGALSAGQLARAGRQPHVARTAGALSLTDITVTGTVPAITAGAGGGSFSSSFSTSTFTVDGVGVAPSGAAQSGLGPLGSAVVTSGRAFRPDDANADVALADAGYATANKLRAGSAVSVGGTDFTVVGIVDVPQGGSPPDLYIPLARAQAIAKTGTASLRNQVNTIYVAAGSASSIPAVQRELTGLLPGATVTDASDLASQVTGSVGNAASLADNLGMWLSAAVLAVAFLLAILLTMSAVSRRVREFGTLKALGWPSVRIVAQVMGESLAIGLAGGVAGVGLGYAGAGVVGALAPRLSASNGAPPAGTPAGAGIAGKLAAQVASAGSHTVYVSLTAPVTLGVILLAVALAIGGGLLAGMFGGWRAARLRPAAALARVE